MNIVAPEKYKYLLLNKLFPHIDSTCPNIKYIRPRFINVDFATKSTVFGIYITKTKSIGIFKEEHFELTFFHEYIHFMQHMAGRVFINSIPYKYRPHEIEARLLSEKLLKSYNIRVAQR